MIKKSFPIKKPYYYDTKEGIDHFTKTMKDESPHKMTPKDNAELDKLNLDMKKSALDHHNKEIKQWDQYDIKTYPSDPKQRGHLLAAGALEKDLTPKLTDLKIVKNNINNRPVKKRNYWDDTMKLNVGNKGPLKLPELTQEEIERAKRPSDWDVIYASMSPIEKGQWNAEKRKEKLQQEKKEYEFNPKKMAQEVIKHVTPLSSEILDLSEVAPVKHAPRARNFEHGLSHNFTHEKLAEGKLVKDILDD